jgi:hypothetical protein
MYHTTGLHVMVEINLFLWESNPSLTIPTQSVTEFPGHTGIHYEKLNTSSTAQIVFGLFIPFLTTETLEAPPLKVNLGTAG